MFTVEQIEKVHQKVESGADFPRYIQDIKEMGVISFETWVRDSHTVYFGAEAYQTASGAQYVEMAIADAVDKEKFIHYLKVHQQGKTNYYTFCTHCAETGIEKWIMNLDTMTCTYYDKYGNEILREKIPH